MLTFLMLVACGDKDGDSAVAPTQFYITFKITYSTKIS